MSLVDDCAPDVVLCIDDERAVLEVTLALFFRLAIVIWSYAAIRCLSFSEPPPSDILLGCLPFPTIAPAGGGNGDDGVTLFLGFFGIGGSDDNEYDAILDAATERSSNVEGVGADLLSLPVAIEVLSPSWIPPSTTTGDSETFSPVCAAKF